MVPSPTLPSAQPAHLAVLRFGLSSTANRTSRFAQDPTERDWGRVKSLDKKVVITNCLCPLSFTRIRDKTRTIYSMQLQGSSVGVYLKWNPRWPEIVFLSAFCRTYSQGFKLPPLDQNIIYHSYFKNSLHCPVIWLNVLILSVTSHTSWVRHFSKYHQMKISMQKMLQKRPH